MVRLTGVIAIVLIAGLPVLVLPEIHLLEASVVAATICLAGLLMASLGLAVLGAVLALLVFSVALLLMASADAIVEAVLMGIAVLTLLDVAYYRQCFLRSAVEPEVTPAHLSGLAISVLLSILAAVILVIVADVLSLNIEASVRPVIAAGGGILVMAAILWAAKTSIGLRSRVQR